MTRRVARAQNDDDVDKTRRARAMTVSLAFKT